MLIPCDALLRRRYAAQKYGRNVNGASRKILNTISVQNFILRDTKLSTLTHRFFINDLMVNKLHIQ